MIQSNYHLNVSTFCNGFIEHDDGTTEVCGYIDPRLFEIYPVVERIFTDNRSVINYIRELDGYVDDKKFRVHYQPVEISKAGQRATEDDGCCRIMWASRISRQKQPELINKIANTLERKHPGKYKIDVYGEVDKNEYKANPIKKSSVVERKGGFSNFSDLPTSEYDIFLYTAKYDGLPNILIEAASQKMPIVASNEGGISELIGDGRGVLVDNYESAEAFVQAIERLNEDNRLAVKCGEAIYELVEKRHSYSAFDDVIRKDIKDE